MYLFRISEQSAAFKEKNRINQSIYTMYLGFLNKVLLLKRIIESINQSSNVSISQSIYLSIYLSIY